MSEGSRGDAAEGLAGAPGVEESHGEGQGDEGCEERRFGGDGDATDGEEADEPGQLHARAGGHDGAVLPGSVQGCVGLGEDDEVFVAIPFAVPAAGHDEERGEEREEDESSSEDEGQGEAGKLFDDRFGHGGEFDDGDDSTDGDDQEDGDNVNDDVDATLRSLAGAHAVVAAQLVIPQAVGPGRSIELQGLIGHALTIALSVNFSRLTKQLCTAQLDTFSLVRMCGFLAIITETARRQRSADGRRHGAYDTAPHTPEVTSSTKHVRISERTLSTSSLPCDTAKTLHCRAESHCRLLNNRSTLTIK